MSVGESDATSSGTPTVEAYLGNNVQVQNATGYVQIEAKSVHAEADSRARVFGGGFVQVGQANSTSTSNATVNAYIGDDATVKAGQSVSVEAIGDSDPVGPPLVDTFNPARRRLQDGPESPSPATASVRATWSPTTATAARPLPRPMEPWRTVANIA